MALTPNMVKPVSPDPFIKEEEDMMLIKLGHYKALVTELDTTNTAVATAQAAADNAQATADANALPYKSYVAILNQSSTSAPTATVINSGIGTPTWGRTSAGNYTATLTGVFVSNKTVVFATGLGQALLIAGRINANVVSFKTYTDAGVISDNLLQTTSIEIRVYN